MGAYSRAMWDQAEEDFSAALVALFREWFQRGSDSLGVLPGPVVLAATVRVVGDALSKAADHVEDAFSDVTASDKDAA
jgi:hypothetical protein